MAALPVVHAMVDTAWKDEAYLCWCSLRAQGPCLPFGSDRHTHVHLHGTVRICMQW